MHTHTHAAHRPLCHRDYTWSLTCPGQLPVPYVGPAFSITAGPGASGVDTAGATAPVACGLSLVVTNAAGATATASTTVTVT